MERQKSIISFSIPLLHPAENILSKYDLNTLAGLPLLSNQKMNSYLKVIAEILQIKRNLTTHVARHTFTNSVTLNNNVPIVTVSKMLGHTELKTTQLYAKVQDIKVKNDTKYIIELFQ